MEARFSLSYGIAGVSKRNLNNCKDIDILEHVCKKNMCRAITDVNEFVKNLAAIKEQPYTRALFGENDRECLTLRNTIAKHINYEDTSKMYAFAAWTLWEQRKNQIYIGSNVIYAFCSNNKLDPKEFMRAAWLGFTGRDSPKLDASQNIVLKRAIGSPFTCVQGGAGVGKTTTVSEIINQVKKHTVVATVTFTHKAKRCVEKRLLMAGIEGVTTSTIHSFIYSLKSTKIPRLFLIVDESSMVDLELLGELAKQMLENCDSYQLCFVGDKMQLPSVGRGEIFRMMIESNGAHVNSLTKCYRTDKPDLFDAYEKIRAGELPESTANVKVHMLESDKEIDSFAGKFIGKHRAEYMYVAWQNKDVFKINRWVQSGQLKLGKIGPSCWKNFYLHDRVVYRGENTDTLTNAMTGTVTMIEFDGMTVQWDDSPEVTSFKKEARGVQLMYCGTCHIMQGSEYKQVCVLGYDIPKMIKCSDRKWIYTAATRAQDNVVLVSTKDIGLLIGHPEADAPLSSLKF
eukprot:gene19597-26280_t